MREDVDRTRLRRFLEELGRTYHGRARLYLTGGDSFVWRGLRDATRDIDVAYDVAPSDHAAWIDAIVKLKERLDVSVEEAQPADFVPIPAGAAERVESVGRFGGVEVFLCDPYSIAMAKLDRGARRDLADVRSLIAAGVVAPDRLRQLVEGAIRSDPLRRARFDPGRVRRNLTALLAD